MPANQSTLSRRALFPVVAGAIGAAAGLGTAPAAAQDRVAELSPAVKTAIPAPATATLPQGVAITKAEITCLAGTDGGPAINQGTHIEFTGNGFRGEIEVSHNYLSARDTDMVKLEVVYGPPGVKKMVADGVIYQKIQGKPSKVYLGALAPKIDSNTISQVGAAAAEIIRNVAQRGQACPQTVTVPVGRKAVTASLNLTDPLVVKAVRDAVAIWERVKPSPEKLASLQ